jgi:chloramphenicol 3-O phosphotransferase
MSDPGEIVVLNGAPRSGKSSIARTVQETLPGTWINLGVDVYMSATPPKLQPGIGLRPGGERPDLEPDIALMYRALYDSIAVHARNGLNVVTDIGHHDRYSEPRGVLPDAARRLDGLRAFLIGVRCPVDVIMQRRGNAGEPVPDPIQRWQDAVHDPGIYDLEVDTSQLSPENCAAAIRARMDEGPPSAFAQLT